MRMGNELTERDWLYALVLRKGVGRKSIFRIYEQNDSLANVDWSSYLPAVGRGNGSPCLTYAQVLADKQARERQGVEFICIFDEQFPAALKEIPDPPLLLFYRGNLSLLQNPLIAVVGARKPSTYGIMACQYLTEQLSNAGFDIVSGLAYGIDGQAHRSALESGGGTIGVLGCGIDQIYPRSHGTLYKEVEARGLLLSEYPPGVKPAPGLFPERNRLISGLSLGVLVVEAAAKSGSLVTADCALEQGREVFAVPGSIFSEVSEGPHQLLKQGAKLVTSAADIIEELAYLISLPAPVKNRQVEIVLSVDERDLLALITDQPTHWNELYAKLESGKRRNLDRDLLALEVKNVIKSLPGGYYVRRRKG